MFFLKKVFNIAVAFFYFLLISCKLGPDFHAPQPSSPDHYTEQSLAKNIKLPGENKDAQTLIVGQAIQQEWWRMFEMPEMNQLVQTGLANSPTLIAAQAALKQAQVIYQGQAGSLLLPNVTGQMGYSRNKSSLVSNGFDNAPPQIYNLANAGVNVSYAFDFFGANRRQLESLAAQIDYQRYELAASQISLSTNIVTTIISISSLQEQILATQNLISAQKAQLRIAEQQLKLGAISQVAYLTQEGELAQSQATLPGLREQLAQQKDALAVLVGVFPASQTFPFFNWKMLHLPEKLPLSLPSTLVQQRPDVQASLALLHVASANIGVATANLFPQISLSANYGWQAGNFSSLFQPLTNVWGLGSSLTQPLFKGSLLISQRKAAIAAYEQANAQYQQVVLQAFQQVADSLHALEQDAASLEAQKLACQTAEKNLRIAQQQIKLGGVSQLYFLTAQRQYQQAKIALIQAQTARLTDSAALIHALGGGWHLIHSRN